jgi:hypothetical protein
MNRMGGAPQGFRGRVASCAGQNAALALALPDSHFSDHVVLFPTKSRGLAGGTHGNHARDALRYLEVGVFPQPVPVDACIGLHGSNQSGPRSAHFHHVNPSVQARLIRDQRDGRRLISMSAANAASLYSRGEFAFWQMSRIDSIQWFSGTRKGREKSHQQSGCCAYGFTNISAMPAAAIRMAATYVNARS